MFIIRVVAARIRAAWGVLTAGRYVVITYDPNKPVNMLDHVYLCAPFQEVPDRLAMATVAAIEWDNIDNQEGQQDALNQATEILSRSARLHC